MGRRRRRRRSRRGGRGVRSRCGGSRWRCWARPGCSEVLEEGIAAWVVKTEVDIPRASSEQLVAEPFVQVQHILGSDQAL